MLDIDGLDDDDDVDDEEGKADGPFISNILFTLFAWKLVAVPVKLNTVCCLLLNT